MRRWYPNHLRGSAGAKFWATFGLYSENFAKIFSKVTKKILTLFVIFRCVPTQISPWVNKIWGWGLVRPKGTDEFYGIP